MASNIEIRDNGTSLDITISDAALIRRYEKACALDEKKIIERIAAFLSKM